MTGYFNAFDKNKITMSPKVKDKPLTIKYNKVTIKYGKKLKN